VRWRDREQGDRVGRTGRLVTLTCALDRDLPVAVVRLAGRLDPGTAPDARLALHQGLAAQPAAMVIDVAGLSGVDDEIAAILGAFARSTAVWPGCPLVVCGVTEWLAAGLYRAGVDQLLEIHPDRAHALSAAGASAGTAHRYWRRLSPTPGAAALARSTVAAACTAWALGALSDRAELVVTELVSNAVLHAGTEMELVVGRRAGSLNVSLRDGCPDPPYRLPVDRVDATGGRGLILIEALATTWGFLPTRDGKVVWAMLRDEPATIR
jgi:anti-anti-sigma regulatory factor/anti-sigma regulatory factor (Ser/Thr protein kinase)